MRTEDYLNRISGVMVRMLTLRAVDHGQTKNYKICIKLNQMIIFSLRPILGKLIRPEYS